MNSKALRLATGIFAASLGLTSLPSFGQITVYNNATVRLDKYYAPGTTQFGDEIKLSGGAGQIMGTFTFEYFASGLVGSDNTVKLRFYQNDGGQVVGGSFPALKPGTKFYDSGTISLVGIDGQGNTRADGNTLAFDLTANNIIIPNNSYDFTWTVQFGGLESLTETAGLDLYNPPNIGQNYDDYWEQNTSTLDWELRAGPAGTPVMSFGASLTAVPEPSPMQIALVAGVLWLGWSLYRRNKATA